MSRKPLEAEQRQTLEASHTWQRLVELRLDPVRGEFDVAHLKEINRRIFQDLPDLGFDEVTPGKYRQPVEGDNDWMKTRSFETLGIRSNVAYSTMDRSAQSRLEDLLEIATPPELAKLGLDEFVRAIGNLYTHVDYIHPFPDGNSRTLREFTRQLAEASGYRLAWEQFGHSAIGRDLLYIGRDISVNRLALPNIQHEGTRCAVILSLDQLEGNRDLTDLLMDAIRPIQQSALA